MKKQLNTKAKTRQQGTRKARNCHQKERMKARREKNRDARRASAQGAY
jgi:hypothetical protein